MAELRGVVGNKKAVAKGIATASFMTREDSFGVFAGMPVGNQIATQ